MTIIKNLIRKNNLRKQLKNIEQLLRENGYYEQENKLALLAYKPDEYGALYNEIHNKYDNLLQQKHKLTSEIQNISGFNLLKKQPDEYSK